MLRDIINNASYTFANGFERWEDAISFASIPLLNQHAINHSYVQAMIDSIEEYGPYVVLDNGVAIPHVSNGAKGCNANGIALMITKKPVIFPSSDTNTNCSASVFFVLAALNDEGHLLNMQNLFSVTMNHEIINDLKDATNLQDLVDISNKYDI
ncbi:MAG: PTS sugar transporter subunit IIA [Erysipelotrichaceae bacterium]